MTTQGRGDEQHLHEAEFDDVLRAARSGADWAWERLYRDVAPALLGYLRGQRLRDPENVLGEVFLQAVRDLRRFDGSYSQFRSWIFTIAHHRMVDQRRKVERRPATDPTPTEDLVRVESDTTAADEALVHLTTGEVVELLDVLSDDQREVLLLRLVGGLSHAEVADMTGKTKGAVKQLTRRALNTLRDHIPDDA